MKLHFYFVKKYPWENGLNIEYVAIEADEKPKTYVVREQPHGIFVNRISKEEIGSVVNGYRVALLERDDETAKKIFKEYYNVLISGKEKEIDDYKNIIKAINEWEG